MAVRVTQVAVEVLCLPTTAAVRTTQVAVEVLCLPTTTQARVTQIAVEVLLLEAAATPQLQRWAQFATSDHSAHHLLRGTFLLSRVPHSAPPATLIDPHRRLKVYIPWYPYPYTI